jgi:N-methylhydantoinase B
MSTATAADPVVAEIIRNGLVAAAKQIELAIIRTSVSPILYDAHDFACGVFDEHARLLGQDGGVPGFLGTLGPAIETSVQQSGGIDALRPGDAILSTDAYSIGSHAQDATIVVPAFVDDTLIGFAAVKGHITDIGQRETLQAVDSNDIWQEGTIYPGVKVFRAGERNEDLWRIVVANSRMPNELAADLNAFLGSARVGVRALERLVRRYGLEGFRAGVERIFDHGEQMTRAALERIPDGRYVSQTVIEGADGATAEPFDVVVEISGSDIVVDYTAAPPQQQLPFNAPVGFTTATTRAFVLALVGGADAANEGYMRPISLRTQPGTMLHPLAPAPVALYFGALDPPEALYRALATALPDAIPGSVGGGTQWLIAYGMADDGSFWGGGFNFIGGQGGAPTHDGSGPLLGVAGGGVRSVSVEIFESRTPFVVEEFAMAPDSGGAGRFRGAPGLDYRIRARRMAFATLIVDGTVHPPGQGINGGLDGRPNSVDIVAPDGTTTSYQKVGAVPMLEGSVVRMHSGGGGGWGDPAQRDPEAVHADIATGVLSEGEARRRYPHAF